MIALASTPRRTGIALLSVIALVAFVGCFVVAPVTAAAQGFLLAFAFWSGFPIGAVALLLIHRLTGGAWGEAIAPCLRMGAWLMGAVFAALLVVLALQGTIYPWARGFVDPSVGEFYLAPLPFTLRALVIAGGLLAFALLPLANQLTPLRAGLGLAFYGLSISVAALDWFVSLDPFHGVTTYGAMIAIEQMMTALAVAAVLLPRDVESRTVNDIGALLVAMLLATAYLELMTYIVMWYGNLPDKVEWYVRRDVAPWRAIMFASIACALLAFCALVPHRMRESVLGLRLVGIVILAGIALHRTWLLGPEFPRPGASLTVAGVVFVGFIALSLAAILAMPARLQRPARALAATPPTPQRPTPARRAPRSIAVTRGRALSRGDESNRARDVATLEAAGNIARDLESPAVDSRIVLVATFGFLGFVAIATGGLGIYYAREAHAPPPAHARTTMAPPLAFPVTEADRTRRDQRAHVAGDIDAAMAAIVARGEAAYDPLAATRSGGSP